MHGDLNCRTSDENVCLVYFLYARVFLILLKYKNSIVDGETEVNLIVLIN